MPIIIKLTQPNGNPLYINAKHILSYYRNRDMCLTYVYYVNDSGDEVRERPEDITDLIKEAKHE